MSIKLKTQLPNVVTLGPGAYRYAIVEKRNDTGATWFDGPWVNSGDYPSERSGKSPTISNPITYVKGRSWRACSSYSRTVGRWSYTPSTEVGPWYSTGSPHDEEARVVQTGCWFGDVHFGDVDIGFVGSAEEINTRQRAATECMTKLGEGKLQLGQFIAESVKSAEAVADAGSSLLRLLLLAKRGQWSQIPKGFGTWVDKFGNGWLQYQYGWKPLCTDIYGIAMQLKNGLQYPFWLSAERTCTSSLSGSWTDYGLDCKGTTKFRAKCGVYATVNDQFGRQANQYGIANPAALGWELVPYSFVADWFVPVGNTLQSLSAPAGLDFVDGYESITRTGQVEMTHPHFCGTATYEAIKFSRQKLNTWPSTWMPYANPKPFSTTRVVSMLALFKQLIS